MSLTVVASWLTACGLRV